MFKEKSKYLRSAESGPIPTEVLSLMIDAQKNREQQDLSSRRIQITSANISSQKKKKKGAPSKMGTTVPVSEKAQFRAIPVDHLKGKMCGAVRFSWGKQ